VSKGEMVRVSRPVGCPAPPDLTVISEEEREGRRQAKEKWRGLVKQAEKGDREVLPAIREALDELPELVWHLSNVAEVAEHNLMKEMTGEGNLLTKEIVPRQLAAMREELAGPAPSPLERLLVERVVATWLQLHYFEARYAASMGNLTMPQSEHHQKRIDRAHRRYLSAIRTLAQVRKLGPALQINIAEKQINVAGGEVRIP
jgi:hypothetical protein